MAVPVLPITFTVVPWGRVTSSELENAISVANAAQKVFRFLFYPDVIPVIDARYTLPHGGLDLDKAARDLLRRGWFRALAASQLILVTGLPYSEQNPDLNEPDPLDRGLFFLDEGLSFAKNIAVVSTYVWERLPKRSDLAALVPDGRRALTPYLLLSFTIIAANRLADMGSHDESRGCPLDYCQHVRDIDRFFEGGGFCEECQGKLESARKNGPARVEVEHINALKRLSNAALGRPAQEGYNSCMIAYGNPDKEFALKLRRDLRKIGVSCWVYEEDFGLAKRTWREIEDKRREVDKMLVLCSVAGLLQNGLRKEIDRQVDEDPDKIVPISLDDLWKHPGFVVRYEERNLKPYLVDQNWGDVVNLGYRDVLKRLTAALRWQ